MKRSIWRVLDLLRVGSLNSRGYEASSFEDGTNQLIKAGSIPHVFYIFLNGFIDVFPNGLPRVPMRFISANGVCRDLKALIFRLAGIGLRLHYPLLIAECQSGI